MLDDLDLEQINSQKYARPVTQKEDSSGISIKKKMQLMKEIYQDCEIVIDSDQDAQILKKQNSNKR